nr:hypothetical protein [Tanacetum cinerariifolium]
MIVKRIGELERIMDDLIQVNKDIKERLDSHGSRLYTLEQLDIPQRVSIALFEALRKSMNRDHSEELAQDLDEARKKRKKSRKSPKRHLGHHLISHLLLLHQQAVYLIDLRRSRMDEDMAPDEQVQSSDDEDIGKPAWSIRSSDVPVPMNNWASALASSYSPPLEDSLLSQTSDIATFMDWFCKRRGIPELKPQDMEGPAYEIIKVFHPDVIHLQYQMEECH